MKTSFNKFLYIGFLLIGLYQVFFSTDYLQTASSLGIALAFDPFDQTVTWKDRPFWQRAWLIAHLALCAGSLGCEISMNDRFQDVVKKN